jgi:hypothetical protein
MMREAARLAMRRSWLGVLIAAVLILAFAKPRAQPAPTGDDAVVLSADDTLGQVLRTANKWTARRMLSLEFTFVDENGGLHERKDFLANLKNLAAAPASDATIKSYGRIAMVTGRRKSAFDNNVFYLDIWEKEKGAWRALLMQDVVLATPDAAPADPVAPATSSDCKNPCQVIPYRVRSPTEQDIVTSFQAIEKAAVAHNADEWAKHVADEFVLYGTGRMPISKSDRIAAIERQKQKNAVVTVGEVQDMHLTAYDIGAAMIATHAMPDNSRPPYRAARVWVKRNGQWQMAISVQTNIRDP